VRGREEGQAQAQRSPQHGVVDHRAQGEAGRHLCRAHHRAPGGQGTGVGCIS
jgi:hypothetical protein